MARKRVSMREGPLAELFRATEAAQRRQAAPSTARQALARPDPAPTEILSVVPDPAPEPAPTSIAARGPAEPEQLPGRALARAAARAPGAPRARRATAPRTWP